MVNGNGVPGLCGMMTDSSEDPELKWLARGPNSVAAWEKMTGGLSATASRSTFSETLIRCCCSSCRFCSPETAIACVTWRWREAKSGGRGCWVFNLSHQLRIVVLRAKLGITVEKSGRVPSSCLGEKLRSLQT